MLVRVGIAKQSSRTNTAFDTHSLVFLNLSGDTYLFSMYTPYALTYSERYVLAYTFYLPEYSRPSLLHGLPRLIFRAISTNTDLHRKTLRKAQASND